MVNPVIISPRRKPKVRWTPAEEQALKSGVNKHGAGKWKNIIKDPEFGPCLVSRTNIDLKDKWRNLCGESSYRPKFKAVSTKCAPCNPADVEVYTEVERKNAGHEVNSGDESTVSDTGASEGSVEVSSKWSRGGISGMMHNPCYGSSCTSAQINGARDPVDVLVDAMELIDSHDLVRVSEEPTTDSLVPDNPEENKLAVPNFLRKRSRERPLQNYAIQKKAVKKFKSSMMVDLSNLEILMMAVNHVSKDDDDDEIPTINRRLVDTVDKSSEAVLVNKSVSVSSGIHRVLDDMSANTAEDQSSGTKKLTSFQLSILPEGNTVVSDQSLGIKKSSNLGIPQKGNTDISPIKSSKVCPSYDENGFSRINDDQRAHNRTAQQIPSYMSAEKSCKEQCMLTNAHGGNMGGCEYQKTSNMASEQRRLQKNSWRERKQRLDAEAEAYILKDRQRQYSFLLQHSFLLQNPSTNSQQLQAPPPIRNQHVKSDSQVLGHDTSVKISTGWRPSYNEKGFVQTVCGRRLGYQVKLNSLILLKMKKRVNYPGQI